jgi:lysophospholipase L1-like esterase
MDFVYSSLIVPLEHEPRLRVPDPVYHHGLAANFDGYDDWGGRFRLFTDNLGFKDFAVRDVVPLATTRRILLIGDSFTEGVGMTFDQSFAGLLYRAGQARDDKIEFLNAAVVSYSPVIYYKKIKYLLELGIRFDEVVVFSDESDVQDEATSYFCLDEDPSYRKYCNPSASELPPAARPPEGFFEAHFSVTNGTRVLIKQYLQALTGHQKRQPMPDVDFRIGWSLPGVDASAFCQPLGCDGGIVRSRQNMGKLADLLAQRGIPLTIVVYPWPTYLARNLRENAQVQIWREFCQDRCKAFIDLFPAFFAEKASHDDWYERLFISGDVHFSAEGNRLMFQELAKRLL